MTPFPQLPLPSPSRAVVVWLLGIFLGDAFFVCYAAFFSTTPSSSHSLLPIGPFVASSVVAAFFSLPVVLVLPASARWAFSPDSFLQRHLRLLLAISTLFAITQLGFYLFVGCCLWLFDSGRAWQHASMVWIALPYLPATLLAAYLLYAKWLFPTG